MVLDDRVKLFRMTKRKFRIGQKVVTKSGLVGKVIGSAGFPYLGYYEYRIKVEGKSKTMYRKESELKAYKEK